MRGSCSCARALVLAAALVLVIISSCSDVADGVTTTTPNPPGGSDDAGRLDGSAAPSDRGTDNSYKPHQATVLVHGGKPAVEDGPSLLATRQRAASGSRLPDCAHACGACYPCRRVMVSFMCAEGESESCPVAYRCMCRGRFFRVPSI